MGSFGTNFHELWTEIPKADTFEQYICIANRISVYRMAGVVTGADERVLLNCLEAFVDSRYAPKTRAEWKQMYEQEVEK